MGLKTLRPSARKPFFLLFFRKPKATRIVFPTKEFLSLAPWDAVFALLDPLLIGVIQIKCQNAKESLFEANAAIMWIFVVTIFIYCFALTAYMKLHNSSYFGLSRNVSLLAGSLSSVSLVSVLLPYYPKLIMFILWAVLPLILARTSIRRICKSLCEGTMPVIRKVISLWNWLRGE